MTLTNLQKAPFPWFGGKRKAAPIIWQLLGDPAHYVEPFAGSLAVLLERPHPCNRSYYSETVNDLDGFIVNVWRSIRNSPDLTAEACSWPVTEADKIARQVRLLEWRATNELEHLMGDPDWHDPVMAGWWLYAVACQIGAFTADGPWVADPVTGRLIKQGRPGVRRGLPHLGDNGRGVNHAGAREPGVSDDDHGFHPWTMPEIRRWFAYLSARLRHVRIVNGDWQRVATRGASHTIPVRMSKGHAGIFLDPPYDTTERAGSLYAHETDGDSIPAAVRAWCLNNGDDPKNRIVLAGYDTEHAELEDHGWTVHEWFTAGYLTGGMGNTGGADHEGHQQHRERLWASPHCAPLHVLEPDLTLFDVGGTAP